MNAEEARTVAINAVTAKENAQLFVAQGEIKSNAEKGIFSATIYENLMPGVKLILENAGFAITPGSDRGEPYFTIAW